jgi:hypothetical protein
MFSGLSLIAVSLFSTTDETQIDFDETQFTETTI